MHWLLWLWNYTWVGALIIFAIVYALGFYSGRATAQVERQRDHHGV